MHEDAGHDEEGLEDVTGDADDFPGAPPPEPSGIAAVDDVVTEVARLGERPLAEHADVFGRAHEELRRALDDDPGPA